MILYRMKNGELLLNSVIKMNEENLEKLEQLGNPSLMIVPNRFHRLDAAFYKKRYPHIRVLTPRKALPFVEKKVPVDETCESFFPTSEVKALAPRGTKSFELCYELKLSEGKALVVADLFMNLPKIPGFSGLLFKLIGSTGYFGMTPLSKLVHLKNKNFLKDWLTETSQRKDIKVITTAHGKAITKNCSEALEKAAKRA